MKKVIIIFLYFFVTLSLYSQQTNDKIDTLLRNKVINFIDTINKFYINYDKHAVFVIKSFNVDTNRNFCFSMSFILNAYEYKYIEPNYYFKYQDNIVLISFGNMFDKSIFNVFLPEKINAETKIKIMDKLCPKEEAATYEPPGFLICRINDNIKDTFFENADEIPLEESIFKNFPEGGATIKIK